MKKENIVYCSQSQTVRKSFESEPSISLCTVGVESCVGILIKDQKGNASLSHVESFTDMSFIEDELTFIRRNGGDPEVFIYSNSTLKISLVKPDYKSPAHREAEKYFKEKNMSFYNVGLSSNVILYHDTTGIKNATSQDIAYLDMMKGEARCAEGNPELLQVNMYKIQMRSALNKKKFKPILTFDGKEFKEAQVTLDQKIARYVFSDNATNKNTIGRFFNDHNIGDSGNGRLYSLQHVIPRYIALVSNIALRHKTSGNERYKKKKFTEAIELYQKALDFHPYFKEAYMNTGLCYMNLEKYELALESFNQAIAIDGGYQKAIAQKNKVSLVLNSAYVAPTL